jgi:CDP-2,3-bis-(O-geranylgeranyl)-sn-glycerol synthase
VCVQEALRLVVQVLYLFAPLLVASALAGVVMRFDLAPWLKRPIDAGRTWRGKRIFGDGKTWRGVAVALVGCIATVLVQKHVVGERAGFAAVIDYGRVNAFLFGAAMAVGAVLGELPNSFVKRQLGIGQGRTTRGPLSVVFYVLDQVDLLIFTLPLLAFWFRPSATFVLASFLVTFALHPTVSLIGRLIGARKTAR